MQDEVNQQISGFIDGELGDDETMGLLKKMQMDNGLKTKLCRYQAISQALKTDEFYQVQIDFSRRVSQKIQDEPAFFLPQLKQDPQPQTKQAARTKMLAIAASVAVVAVVIGQSYRDNPANHTITAMSVPQLQTPTAFAKTKKLKQYEHQPLNAQFNEYLQAHNTSVYTNGEAEFQPYAKIVSYGQR